MGKKAIGTHDGLQSATWGVEKEDADESVRPLSLFKNNFSLLGEL